MLKQAVYNSTFNGIATFATFGITLLFAGFTIRYLGDQRAGFLLTLQSIVALGTTLGGFGFGTAAVRKVAAFYVEKNLKGARDCLGAVLLVNITIGVLMALIIIIGFPVFFRWAKIDLNFRHDALFAAIIFSLAFAVQQIANTFAITFSALQRYEVIALLSTIFGFLNGGMGLLALLFFRTMASLSVVTFLLAFSQVVVNIILAQRMLRGNVFPALNLPELRSMTRFGGWAWLASLGGMVNSSLDKIAITSYLGSSAIPYYAVGQRVVVQVHTAIASQSQFIFPMLSAKGDKAGLAASQVEDRLRWFIAFSAAVIYGGLAICAYPLLNILVGSDFAKRAFVPFILACLQGFLVAQSIVSYQISWAEGQGAPNAVYSFISGLLTFITIILFATRLGILAASLAQLWIGPMALILVGWVLLAGRRFHWLAVFRPIFSPLFIWLGMVGFGVILYRLEISSYLIWLPLAALGGLLIPSLGLLLEYWIFRNYRCNETLISAIRLFFNRYFGRHINQI
jgi:O-antigen/teichoic acid export membrane protein